MHFRFRFLWCITLLVLITGLALSLSGIGARPALAKVYKISFKPVKQGKKVLNWNKKLPSLYKSRYYKLQGSTTDGKYIYSNYWNKYNDKCIIVKFNVKTKRRIRSSKPLNIDHGNDLAYNPNTRRLYAVDNYKFPYRITMIDPKTLTVCGKVDVQMPATLEGVDPDYIPDIDRFVGITYDNSRHQYALRVSGYNDFIITDEAFTPLKYVTVSKDFELRRQTIDCDQDHVYVTLDKQGYYNMIAAYDWDGVYKYKIRIGLKSEIQSVCRIGNYHYATFYDNRNGKAKSYIYKFKMP